MTRGVKGWVGFAVLALLATGGCRSPDHGPHEPEANPVEWDPTDVTRRTPSEWAAYFNRRGIELLKESLTTEARREFRRALYFQPENIASEYFLGVCSCLEGAYDTAIQQWQLIVEQHGMVARYKLRGAIDIARKAKEPGERFDPDDPKRKGLPPPPPRGLKNSQKATLIGLFGPKG